MKLMMIYAVLLLMACSGMAAKVHVKGDNTLLYSVLKENALVNPNRNYTFQKIPQEVLGLQYTLHNHKAASSITLNVKEASDIYICLVETEPGLKIEPKDLKLEGEWQEVGSATVEAGGTYGGAFYKRAVKKDEQLTIPSMNKWGTIVIAKELEGLAECCTEAEPKKTAPNAKQAKKKASGPQSPLYPGEFGALASQIQDRPNWNNERLAKESLRQEALVLDSDKTPVDIVLRRTAALIADLQKRNRGLKLLDESQTLAALKNENKPELTIEQQQALFMKVTALRRKVAFQNPLLDFDKILFVKHNKQRGGDNHMVDQYLGFNQDPQGGVFILNHAFSDNAEAVSILKDVAVTSGPLKDKVIDNKGSFMSLELDYDAKSILFAFTEAQREIPKDFDPKSITDELERLKNEHFLEKTAGHNHYLWLPERVFHVFRADLDPETGAARNLKQLTFGRNNDFDPCFLPSGRIVFISDRIGGNQRCGTRLCSTYTLHAMMPDGSDVMPLSYHDTNEWHPSVDNNGMIIYSRWDYVDRDSDIAHHIWHCFPDGRDPRSYHGNWPEMREMRPWMELANRAIPNSHKYVGVSTPHHGQNYGSLVLIDLMEKDDKAMSQLKRITPEAHFPESESAPGHPHKAASGRHNPNGEFYGQPWPLSEDYYLAVYDSGKSNYGLYLIDSFGNRELLYRDSKIAALDPIPFKSRPRPPALPIKTTQAKADSVTGEDRSEGVVTIMNIYEGEYAFPEGTKIKELRIVHIFSKPNLTINEPNIGKAAQSLCRGVLGTVPVEEDGSVHFKMPTEVPVYFQAIDEKGLCVMTMRSETYLHPGETMACVGCHEAKNTSPKNAGGKALLAMSRPPSTIKPEGEGSYPLTFARLVQPVLDAKCVACHAKGVDGKKGPSLSGTKFGTHGWSESFAKLQGMAWGKSGGNGAIKINGRSYSLPAQDGARVSKLYQLLAKGHHELQLTPEEMRRITLWIDCNSNFYGAYTEPEKQAKGEVVKPLLSLSPHIAFEKLVR
jgi:cytochrome c553